VKTVQALFLTWWLFSGGAGFIAFVCAKGFWRDYRKKKAEGQDYRFAFWTAFMFACFAAEAAITVIASPLTTTLPGPSAEGLIVAIVRRTLYALGMWLWWLKVVR
jgi:hypothetical protein